MRATLLFVFIVIGMTACGSKDEEVAAPLDEIPKKKSHLSAIGGQGASSPGSSPPVNRQREVSRSDSPETGEPGQVVSPRDLSRDLDALARHEEVRQEAARKRAEEEARRAEQRAERVARMREQVASRMLEMDANGDGFLAKEEVSGPLERRFDDSDTSGDGYLDAAEREAMFETLAERINEGMRRGRDRRRGGGRN